MRAINLLYYAVAFFAPVILFAVTLIHEEIPILPWIIWPVMFALAATLSLPAAQRTFKDQVFTKWFASSVLVGLILAAIATFS